MSSNKYNNHHGPRYNQHPQQIYSRSPYDDPRQHSSQQQQERPGYWTSYCVPPNACGPPSCRPSVSVLSSPSQSFTTADTDSQAPSQGGGGVRGFVDGILSPFVRCVQPQLSACISGPAMEWRPSSAIGIRRPRARENDPYRQPAPLSPVGGTSNNHLMSNNSMISHHNASHTTTNTTSVGGGGGGTSRILTSANGVSYGGIAIETPAPADGKANIVRPNDNDVLCGRGNNSNRHPGNIHFRELIAANKTFYSTLTKKEKMLIARQIVNIIQNSTDPPGRFLGRDGNTGLWYDIGLPRSLEKTSQALREKSAAEKNQTEKDSDPQDGGETMDDSVPLSPLSSAGSGVATTILSDDANETDGKCTSKATNGLKTKNGRSAVKVPPITIPEHLQSIYHRERPKSPNSTTTPSAKSVNPIPDHHSLSSGLPPYLQTPLLSDPPPPMGTNFYPPPPPPGSSPHRHYYSNAPPPPPHQHPPSYPVFSSPPRSPYARGPPGATYRHPPYSLSPSLQPRDNSGYNRQEGHHYHANPVPPAPFHTHSTAPTAPHYRPHSSDYHYHHHNCNSLPPRHVANPQLQYPPYSSAAGAMLVTPQASIDYSNENQVLTPIADNRRSSQKDVSYNSSNDGKHYTNYDPTQPAFHENQQGHLERHEHTHRDSPISHPTIRDGSPVQQQDFKRQRTNEESDSSKFEDPEGHPNDKPAEPIALTQAIETQLSLKDRVVGSQRESKKLMTTIVISTTTTANDDLDITLPSSDKILCTNELKSPSALGQGRSRTRGNSCSILHCSKESLVVPMSLSASSSFGHDAHEMDGLAALSTAAFLRLDESM